MTKLQNHENRLFLAKIGDFDQNRIPFAPAAVNGEGKMKLFSSFMMSKKSSSSPNP